MRIHICMNDTRSKLSTEKSARCKELYLSRKFNFIMLDILKKDDSLDLCVAEFEETKTGSTTDCV